MCGICGVVRLNGAPDPAAVDAMRAALVHRGPDEGSTDAFDRCALGHQRLRVLDLDTGQQPVTSESGDVVAVFNGELYNFAELRAELAARGHSVRGTGDTPVIPHLYEELGVGFVERLAGMFAIALWDRSRNRLVLARDRVGKKPLLWTELPDGSLAFASELKALLRLPDVSRELDLRALDAYLALQYFPGEHTALEGVFRLKPGHVLVAEGGNRRVERYWRASPTEADLTEPEWLERVRVAVRDAVARRLRADVPVGALLSGGIDSSIVVAQMAQVSHRPVRTFTVGFQDGAYDERACAREVARHYGTEHEELDLEIDAGALPRLAQAFDEPLGDEAALPLFLVCEQARRRVTVALTGDGGDEAFAGYERYAVQRLARLVPPSMGRAAATVLPVSREPRSPLARARRFFAAAAAPVPEQYAALVEVFPQSSRELLWTHEARPTVELLGAPEQAGTTELQLLDLDGYLPGDLLVKADIASMAHSLELRSPFLDHEVVELGLGLPDALKIRGRTGKIALRRAFAADVPRRILQRRKRGFGVPLSRWFRDELNPLAHDLLLDARAQERGLFRPEFVRRLLDEHRRGEAEHGHRLWCLLMLELWLRTHIEGRA